MFITFQERMYQGYIYADLEEGVGGVGVRTPPVENSNLSLHSKFTEKKPFPYGKQIIPLGPPPPSRKISGSAHVFYVQCRFYVLPILSEFLTHF